MLQGRLECLCTGVSNQSLVQCACALVHRLLPPAAVHHGATLLRLLSREGLIAMWLSLLSLLSQLRQQSQVGSATLVTVYTDHIPAR